MKHFVPKNLVGCTQHKSKLFCIRFARQFSFRSAVIMLLMLTLYNVESRAQFYTVDFNNVCCTQQSSSELALPSFAKHFVSLAADTLSRSADPYANGTSPFSRAKVGTKLPTKKQTQEKGSKTVEKTFFFPKRKAAKKREIPLFDATDSLVLELIRKRLTVCMPLDLVHVNSPYGYRKDPFKKCQKFHDGIDLKAGHELVYCMLPGRVAEVRRGNTGYGNHIVIDHGKLRCLYAHLGDIMVKEGDLLDAGAAVAIASNTGRATGIHLHLALRRLSESGKWESVNPMPFINSLNDYINEYNEKLAVLLGKDKINNNSGIPELTIANLYAELKRQGVKHPKIVLAQALLESAWFKSNLTRTHNNIFGIRTRRGPYQRFDSWVSCVQGYKELVQYKFRDGRETYPQFLARIGYAEDPLYINKVMKIANRL